MKAEKFFTHPLGIMISAMGATLFWGSAFPFIKLGYQELRIGEHDLSAQLLFAGYRFVLAAIIILIFMKVIGKSPRYQAGTIPGLIKVGVFQTFLQYIFFYIGLSMSTGIQASIIAGSTSFFQILLAHFMYKNDPLSFRKIFGLSIGFTAIILINLPQGEVNFSFGIGEILLIFAMFSGALGNNLAKNEAARIEVVYLTAYQMLLGGIGLTLLGASNGGILPFQFTAKAWLLLIYLSIASAGGFLLWNNVMKYNQVGRVSMYLFLIPVFGLFLSVIFLHEPLHLVAFIALALVIVGIILVNRQPDKSKEPAARSVH